MTFIRSLSSPFIKYESDELEKSVYQDYDSDSDVPEELKQDYVDEQTGDAPLKRSVPCQIVTSIWGFTAQGMESKLISIQVSAVAAFSYLYERK